MRQTAKRAKRGVSMVLYPLLKDCNGCWSQVCLDIGVRGIGAGTEHRYR
jgi:hypothetical protein